MIFAAGLSPAWQQILQFESVERGEVNRAQQAHWCASGKVINVALAAHSLEAKASVLSTIGGLTGQAIAAEVDSPGILSDWIEVDAPTRVCTTILEADGTTTELVENTAPVSEQVLDEFLEKFRIHSQVADVTVLTGSVPGNAGYDYYARLIRNLPGQFILDAQGEGLLQALPFSPFMVKPNREELAKTLQVELNDESSLIESMEYLNRCGAQWILVSDGAKALYLSSLEETWKFTPPEVETVNPIGCGDCLAAGIAVAIAEGVEVPEAVKFGISVATVNALQLFPAKVERAQSAEFAGRILSEQIG